MPTHAVNWIEIPVADFDRAVAFYNTIFQRTMFTNMMGGKQMAFLPMDPASRGVGGALVKAAGYVPADIGAKVYLAGGDDLSVVLGRVEAAGGKILEPRMLITPEIGYVAFFRDTEGNRVGLHSPH